MVISATFSKPTNLVEQKFGQNFLRAKIKINSSNSAKQYSLEFFTQKQAFHKQLSESEVENFIQENAGKTFKNALIKTETQEITIISNKKGKITRLERPLVEQKNNSSAMRIINGQKTKNYIIPEGKIVPFLVYLGVMTDSGKIISSKYDKFRQINRFLEFVDDVYSVLQKKVQNEGRPLRICDFGCGKSYLTFALHYYFTEIKNIPVEITGLDLKKDVIDFCNKTAQSLNCAGLKFELGNISDYDYEKSPDLVITLHACDTATDFALDYAIKKNCSVILSVPCCQHEINLQLDENLKSWKKSDSVPEEFAPLLKYGIIKERLSALITDSLRCEYLESKGYSVQVLEFIDIENTPKNLLIRAVKKENAQNYDLKNAEILENRLKIVPTIKKLI